MARAVLRNGEMIPRAEKTRSREQTATRTYLLLIAENGVQVYPLVRMLWDWEVLWKEYAVTVEELSVSL